MINLHKHGGNMTLKMVPLDTAVIVNVKKIQEKTACGIELPSSMTVKEQLAQTKGTVAAIGDMAFEELRNLNKLVPEAGDIVYFKKYSGICWYDEEDDKEYKIINDQDIYSFESAEKQKEEEQKEFLEPNESEEEREIFVI